MPQATAPRYFSVRLGTEMIKWVADASNVLQSMVTEGLTHEFE